MSSTSLSFPISSPTVVVDAKLYGDLLLRSAKLNCVEFSSRHIVENDDDDAATRVLTGLASWSCFASLLKISHSQSRVSKRMAWCK